MFSAAALMDLTAFLAFSRSMAMQQMRCINLLIMGSLKFSGLVIKPTLLHYLKEFQILHLSEIFLLVVYHQDLNKIVFHIEDYKVNKETRDKTKTFECEITAEALIQLIQLYSFKFTSKFTPTEAKKYFIYSSVNTNKQEQVKQRRHISANLAESRSNAFRI